MRFSPASNVENSRRASIPREFVEVEDSGASCQVLSIDAIETEGWSIG